MERLTDRGYAGRAFMREPVPDEEERMVEIIERLAAYEDAGLDPEEVLELKSFTQGGVHKADEGWLHVQALLQAEKDGRLVVLPCKAGDTDNLFDMVEASEEGDDGSTEAD